MNHCPSWNIFALCVTAALCIGSSVFLIACLLALQKQRRATQETMRRLLDMEGAREQREPDAERRRLSFAQRLPTPLSLKYARAVRCAECGVWVGREFMSAIESGGIFLSRKGIPWSDDTTGAPPLVACRHCLDALPYPDYEHWVSVLEESSDE